MYLHNSLLSSTYSKGTEMGQVSEPGGFVVQSKVRLGLNLGLIEGKIGKETLSSYCFYNSA